MNFIEKVEKELDSKQFHSLVIHQQGKQQQHDDDPSHAEKQATSSGGIAEAEEGGQDGEERMLWQLDLDGLPLVVLLAAELAEGAALACVRCCRACWSSHADPFASFAASVAATAAAHHYEGEQLQRLIGVLVKPTDRLKFSARSHAQAKHHESRKDHGGHAMPRRNTLAAP